MNDIEIFVAEFNGVSCGYVIIGSKLFIIVDPFCSCVCVGSEDFPFGKWRLIQFFYRAVLFMVEFGLMPFGVRPFFVLLIFWGTQLKKDDK